MDLYVSTENDDRCRQQLAEQLDAIVEVEAVVETAEQGHHTRRGQKIEFGTRQRQHEDGGQQHAHGHGDPTYPRDGQTVHLALARVIDDPPFGGNAAHHRQAGHGDDHRQQKRQHVQHGR